MYSRVGGRPALQQGAASHWPLQQKAQQHPQYVLSRQPCGHSDKRRREVAEFADEIKNSEELVKAHFTPDSMKGKIIYQLHLTIIRWL